MTVEATNEVFGFLMHDRGHAMALVFEAGCWFGKAEDRAAEGNSSGAERALKYGIDCLHQAGVRPQGELVQ